MTEFWERAFKDKQEMWGLEPAKSTVLTKDFFIQHKVKNVLIPGIGYGRNAQIFIDSGIAVTGIEISQTAIDMAQKHFGEELKIYHGSVTEMPFDNKLYDKQSIEAEFNKFGLLEVTEVTENYPFHFIKCGKSKTKWR